MFAILVIGTAFGNFLFKKTDNIKMVSEPILENVLPVDTTNNKIMRPYINPNVKILKKYYNYSDSLENQLDSIIYYNNVYMQNTGVIYGSEEEFDVIAIADGQVIEVSEDQTFGKTIKIKHQNDAISIYHFLSNVLVSNNKEVKKGDIIGKSGTSNLLPEPSFQLYIEFALKGEFLNIEDFYDKDISEI